MSLSYPFWINGGCVRFYGPAMTPISKQIVPILEKWLELTQSGFEFTEFGEEEEHNEPAGATCLQ